MPVLSFQESLSLEMLRLEKLRAKIFTAIFLVGVLAQLTFFLIRSKGNLNNPVGTNIFLISFIFNLGAAVFGIFHLGFLNRMIRKRNFNLTLAGRITHTTIEALFPTFLLYFVSTAFMNPITVLESPSFYLYFMLIILSTLRLNFLLPVWAGFVSAAGFVVLGLLVLEDMPLNERFRTIGPPRNLSVTYKSFVLLMCGVICGFISNQVQKSITRMIRAREEEDKILSLFSQQTSREVATEILSGASKAESKLMNVCVMFIDIRNFTTLMGRRTAAEILDYQNTFFSTVIEVVYKNKGIINQFLGDGCMVTFGAPQPLDNPCEAAVKTAYEIKEEIEKKVREGVLPSTTIGIGIHAGEAVTGNIGNEIRQQYSIIGSVVILAARIEQLNKEFGSHILASQDVIRNINTDVVRPKLIGSFTLKGWDIPINIYKLA